MNILEEIVSYKRLEVEKNKDKLPIEKLKKAKRTHPENQFVKTIKLKTDKKQIALIAEVKKASPSKGIIRENFNHIEIARSYEKGGASCLSVLTDEKYFKGNLKFISEIKKEVNLPVLRKDFIIDPYQVYESVYNQADCILLIVTAFLNLPVEEKNKLKELCEIALENKLDVLIEVHDEREMEIALDVVGACRYMPLLGINNRNLKTFETDLNTTKNLAAKYKHDLQNRIVVSESGIFTNDDIKSLIEYDVFTFLVGESLMREENIESATRNLIRI